jgi:hypothetical protein
MKTFSASTLLVLLLGIASHAAADECPPKMTSPFDAGHLFNDLIGRYRPINTSAFRQWVKENDGIARWDEELINGGPARRVVVVPNKDLHAVEFVGSLEMGRNRIFDLRFLTFTDSGATSAGAFDAAMRLLPKGSVIRAVVPSVGIRGKVAWNVEVKSDGSVSRYRFDGRSLRLLDTFVLTVAPLAIPFAATAKTAAPAALADDTLDSNDVHHLAAFAIAAKGVVGSTTDIMKKAQLIYAFVSTRYAYRDDGVDADKFTLSDQLIQYSQPASDKSLGAGYCDELSVMAVTYLRAVGVHARIRFLTSSNSDAHAFVEFNDKSDATGIWHHMDLVQSHLLDTPAVYRTLGMKDILLMIADHPDDARSDADCFKAKDPRGDGKFCPYCDFVLTPAYPGEKQDPYSD